MLCYHRRVVVFFLMDLLSLCAPLKSPLSGVVLFFLCSCFVVGTKERSMTSKYLLLQSRCWVVALIHVMGSGGVVGTDKGGLTMTSWSSVVLVVLSFSCPSNNSILLFEISCLMRGHSCTETEDQRKLNTEGFGFFLDFVAQTYPQIFLWFSVWLSCQII